jgi:hypothetical protein
MINKGEVTLQVELKHDDSKKAKKMTKNLVILEAYEFFGYEDFLMGNETRT